LSSELSSPHLLRDRSVPGGVRVISLVVGFLWLYWSLYEVDLMTSTNQMIEPLIWLVFGLTAIMVALVKFEMPIREKGDTLELWMLSVTLIGSTGVLLSITLLSIATTRIFNDDNYKFIFNIIVIISGALLGVGISLLLSLYKLHAGDVSTSGPGSVGSTSQTSMNPSDFWDDRENIGLDYSERLANHIQRGALQELNRHIINQSSSFVPLEAVILGKSAQVEIHEVMKSYITELAEVDSHVRDRTWTLCISDNNSGPLDDYASFRRSHLFLAKWLPDLFSAVRKAVFEIENRGEDASWARLGTWLHHMIASDEFVTGTNLWKDSLEEEGDERMIRFPLHYLNDKLFLMYSKGGAYPKHGHFLTRSADRLLSSVRKQTKGLLSNQVATSALLCFCEEISKRASTSDDGGTQMPKERSSEELDKHLRQLEGGLGGFQKAGLTSAYYRPSDELSNIRDPEEQSRYSKLRTPLEKFVHSYIDYVFGGV